MASWECIEVHLFASKGLQSIKIILELFKEEYKVLWGISCEELLKEDSLNLIFKLSNKLEEIYVEKERTLMVIKGFRNTDNKDIDGNLDVYQPMIDILRQE